MLDCSRQTPTTGCLRNASYVSLDKKVTAPRVWSQGTRVHHVTECRIFYIHYGPEYFYRRKGQSALQNTLSKLTGDAGSVGGQDRGVSRKYIAVWFGWPLSVAFCFCQVKKIKRDDRSTMEVIGSGPVCLLCRLYLKEERTTHSGIVGTGTDRCVYVGSCATPVDS